MSPEIREHLRVTQAGRRDAERRETQRRQDMVEAHRADSQVREMRLAEALAEGFLDPDLHRLTVSKLRQDAMRLEVESKVEHSTTIPNPAIGQADTIIELHAALSTDGQRALVELLFEDLWIDHSGIVRYVLRRSGVDAEGTDRAA